MLPGSEHKRAPGRPTRGSDPVAFGVLLALLACVAITIVGCGGPRTFIHPDVDISFYEALGVLPFRNLTNDRLAGEKVSSVFVTELLVKEIFDVKEPGQFRRTAREILPGNIDSGGEWPHEKIRELGMQTGVQGIVTGTVREYEMVRIGQSQYPLVTIDVELIDVETGRVVWRISHSGKGGPNLPFLSVGETHTLGDMTLEVCRDVVDRIAE